MALWFLLGSGSLQKFSCEYDWAADTRTPEPWPDVTYYWFSARKRVIFYGGKVLLIQ